MRRIEEKIQQWSEYESALERLLVWLSEAEAILKNYTLKNSMQEKTEQLEKYQVTMFICNNSYMYNKRININYYNPRFD